MSEQPNSPESSVLSEHAREVLARQNSFEAALSSVDSSAVRRRFSRLASALHLSALSCFVLALLLASGVGVVALVFTAGLGVVAHALYMWGMLIARFDPRANILHTLGLRRARFFVHAFTLVMYLLVLLGFSGVEFAQNLFKVLIFTPVLDALAIGLRGLTVKRDEVQQAWAKYDIGAAILLALPFILALIVFAGFKFKLVHLSILHWYAMSLPALTAVIILWWLRQKRSKHDSLTDF